ncbi:MAG TPA: AgmX/PglI C-terminal domain-containing protein [Polyangiaceae bacterium]|nr:AgmX/PglI C-terminal domain-containing protein [Polyangiaceae bacterium]
MSRFSKLAWLAPLTLTTSLLVACGDSTPAAKTADDQPETHERHDSRPSVSSEIGGLNEDEVNASFESSLKGLQRCLNDGASRVEFLGGSVSFFVKIDSDGKVDAAYLEKSTLGDRDTEKCMLDAMRARSWPKPVGGEHGLARKSFDFDPPNDVRAPADYDHGHLDKGLGKISSKLASCKSAKGSYEATIYVATDGSVLSAGVTPPSEDGEGSIDCLVSTLKSASFPSPGSWPAKVTFTL